jgi:hypothetical protein
MPHYSDIKMDTTEMVKLQQALSECSCIKDPTKRNFILQELSNIYPAIQVENCDPITQIGILIRTCQNYQGALERLILIIDEIYEQGSIPMNNVKQVIWEIFSPSPIQPRLRKDGDRFVIYIPESGQSHDIPLTFSPSLDRDELSRATQISYTWKQVHTLCELWVTDFMPVYKYINNGQVELAKTNIKNFRERCKIFSGNLESLDKEIFSFGIISYLRIIPYCIDPILETMNFPPKTPYFILGQELADLITTMLLGSLSLADRILDEHLYSQTKEGTQIL